MWVWSSGRFLFLDNIENRRKLMLLFVVFWFCCSEIEPNAENETKAKMRIEANRNSC